MPRACSCGLGGMADTSAGCRSQLAPPQVISTNYMDCNGFSCSAPQAQIAPGRHGALRRGAALIAALGVYAGTTLDPKPRVPFEILLFTRSRGMILIFARRLGVRSIHPLADHVRFVRT